MFMIKYATSKGYSLYFGIENDVICYNVLPIDEREKDIVSMEITYKDYKFIEDIKGVKFPDISGENFDKYEKMIKYLPENTEFVKKLCCGWLVKTTIETYIYNYFEGALKTASGGFMLFNDNGDIKNFYNKIIKIEKEI